MAANATVAVYATRDVIFVISQQMTDHGRVSIEPMLKIDRTAAAGVAGEAVLQCLDAFQEIDGPPRTEHLKQLLGLVGARSWTAFAKSAINVSVEGLTKDRVSMCAARADGRGAYAYGPSRECDREPGAVGELLLEMIDELSPAGR